MVPPQGEKGEVR